MADSAVPLFLVDRPERGRSAVLDLFPVCCIHDESQLDFIGNVTVDLHLGRCGLTENKYCYAVRVAGIGRAFTRSNFNRCAQPDR